MGRAEGPVAAPKGLGSTLLRTRHQPTHPTDSPDRDGGRDEALKRARGAPQRPYSGSLGFPGAPTNPTGSPDTNGPRPGRLKGA